MVSSIIFGVSAVIAGVGGIRSGTRGAAKIKKANNIMKSTEERHKLNLKRLEGKSKVATKKMDRLGEKELFILKSFGKFSTLIEKIQNCPLFDEINCLSNDLPKCDIQKIKKVSDGAKILIGDCGEALSNAGEFAAGGAINSAVMAVGAASTGTAISTLSGIAVTNAKLAAIGGGSLAACGSGIAFGTALLGATTIGMGFLVGGALYNVTGSNLSQKAEEAHKEMLEAEKNIDNICEYLKELKIVASDYYKLLYKINFLYEECLNKLRKIVVEDKKIDWNDFSENEKLITRNTVLLVQLLFKMCQVKLVLASNDKNGINSINQKDIKNISDLANSIINNNDFNIDFEEQDDLLERM